MMAKDRQFIQRRKTVQSHIDSQLPYLLKGKTYNPDISNWCQREFGDSYTKFHDMYGHMFSKSFWELNPTGNWARTSRIGPGFNNAFQFRTKNQAILARLRFGDLYELVDVRELPDYQQRRR